MLNIGGGRFTHPLYTLSLIEGVHSTHTPESTKAVYPIKATSRSHRQGVFVVVGAEYLKQPKPASRAASPAKAHRERGRVWSCDSPSLPFRRVFHCFKHGDHLLQLSAEPGLRSRIRDNFAEKQFLDLGTLH